MANPNIKTRDEKIDEAKQYLKKIGRELKSLEEFHSGLDCTKIREAFDSLSEIIQNLSYKIPETTISSRKINNLLKLLEGMQSRTALLIDIETNLVILGSKIHLLGVIQKIIENPDRRRAAPKSKIWKNVQLCFPKFMGFNLNVHECGARYIYQKAYSFCVKFTEIKSKKISKDSNLSPNLDLSSALKAFVPILESFIYWEVEKYKVEEHFWFWTMEKDSMVMCQFSWRTWEEEYDITR